MFFSRGNFSQSTLAIAAPVWNLFKECTWIRGSKTCWISNVFIPKPQPSLFPSWEDHWTIADLEDTHMSYKVFCNPDIQIQTFLDQKRFLAAIQTNGDVTLMFTVGTKQKFPLCTRVNCSKQTKCSCYRKYRKILEGDGEEDEERSPYYWERRTRQKPALVDHYMENLPLEEHQ